MTREQKIAKARELRADGLTYREIGERLGVRSGQGHYWATQSAPMPIECYVCGSPFVPAHGNQKTCCGENARKRFHETEVARVDCPRCGQKMRAGSGYQSHTPEMCAECRRDDAYSRTVRFIELREQGLNNIAIEQREGFKPGSNIVANTLCRASRYGLKVPPPPYWSRGKAAA